MTAAFASPDQPRRRYLLALADAADMVEKAEDVTLVRRLPAAVLVSTSLDVANELARRSEYVVVYRDQHEALLALSLFDRQ